MATDILPKELKERLDNNEKINIIDVREEWEFDEYHIESTLIPLGQLVQRFNEIEGIKNEEIIVLCRSGNRSNQAKVFLQMKGFSNVRNLIGGLLSYSNF